MAKKKRRVVSKKRYSTKSIIREREYGFYWYAWIWRIARPTLILLCALLISLGLVATGWNYVNRHLLMPMNPGDPATVEFNVPRGASVARIGELLEKQNLLRNKGIFRYTIMFQGVTDKIQYGNYQISPSMTIGEIIGVLTSGSSSTERTITIIPGWTVEDVAASLHKAGAIKDIDEFKKLCNDTVAFGNYYTIQQAIEDHSLIGRKYALEGYLAPNTYQVFIDATAEDIVKKLMDQTDVVLNNIYDKATSGDEDAEAAYQSTLTRDQTIILASMIEKEAVKDEDFARVSAVFHNRLKAGMRLESDPTVKYTLGIQKMALTNEELSVDTPYNTYLIPGLPVGPICNPSQRAIEAALYPDMAYIEQNYLFFCSKDPSSGELQFSKTKEEHDAAVAQYRPLWQAYDQAQAQKAAEQTAEPTAQPTPGS